ncbi:MAG: hypothetical protein M3016_05300 [Actinomycetota bacterium]|nr:hypothetical protein [Actinomycetota bacterium]
MEPKAVSDSCAILAHWMGVNDANSAGNIHGGTIMKLADEVAGLAAIKYARQSGGDGGNGPDGLPGPTRSG